jgi:putative phosphoesterase
MRILVLADIHSNWAALRAIQEEFDRCVVIGDLVDYGADPLPCIDWVRRHADACVRGNHDHAVAQRVQAVGSTGYRRLAAATRPLHWQAIDPARMKFLARLPVSTYYRAGPMNLFLIHATPRDPMDEYLTADAAAWKQRLADVQADFVCVGHSHIPFHLDLGTTQVVNPGSVGQPRDGDWRASYAIIEDGKVTLRRVEYDLSACVEQMRGAGVDPWAVKLSEAVLRSGGVLTREEMDAIL